MHLTARPYLLAGFTAASIVASVSLAPGSTVHLPSAHAADVRLAAAESELVSEVRELRAVQTRALASVFERTTTAVVPRLARSSSSASATAPSSAATSTAHSSATTGTAHSSATTGTAQHSATTAAAQGSVTLADVNVLVQDVTALTNDVTGAPAVVLIQAAIATQLAINDVVFGHLQNIPGDVVKSLELGISPRINAIGNDLGAIATELNHIVNLALAGATMTNRTTSHLQDAAVAVSKLAVPLKSGAVVPRPSISKPAPSTPTFKPAGHGYTPAGTHPAKQSSTHADGMPKHSASGTSTPKHRAPSGHNTDGPKHRKR